MAENKKTSGFSKEEIAAMKARAKELAAEQKAVAKREIGEAQVLEAIEKMPEPDKSLAKKVHQIVTNTAPQLWPKTWYGFPAYALDDKIICFLQFSSKFGTRYSTLGFNDGAKLDDGNIWPVAYAIKSITPKEEKEIENLVKKALN